MLRCLCNSTFKSSRFIPSSDNACLATLSASEFWLHGTCMKSSWSNSWINWLINLRYFCIWPSFASYSPFICPITSLELLLRSMFLAPRAFSILSPISTTSYSTSLLVARNWSHTFKGFLWRPQLPLFSKLMSHLFVSSSFLKRPMFLHRPELWTQRWS